MFFSLLVVSTMITISAISWFTAWIGLEMNLLSIIPLMQTKFNKFSAEASIKYFIIQAMASSILLFSIIMNSYMNFLSFNLSSFSALTMDLALILKMGAAPLHFWLPEVISGLNWSMVLITLTWQKIAPMILLSYCNSSPLFLSTIIIMSSAVGGVLGLNQVCLRKFMAFSSINHMGWMISTLMCSMHLWFYYFLIYCFLSAMIILMFYKFNLFFMNQISKLLSYNKNLKIIFMLNFLSLGGLPPFIGFFPKWVSVNFLILNNYIALSLILVIFTLISLYFYTRITLSTITMNSCESLLTPTIKSSAFWPFFMNFLTATSLVMCFNMTSMF
uniref:NADH-ubiquinone oxidoreductase chain 2 n=1 Tax=Trigonopterus sp. 8 AH-2016 TaxID=1903842 RepID=A0A343C437_9CUCU|nr:NADH dehydrogenase subunit 2 [Trigonopterus sp. 8 AH-2016]